jgi:alkylation response protein AidB-like acyl-CoA dehydrogenase
MTHVWKGSSVTRLLPTAESVDLMAMVEDFASKELAPRSAEGEARGEFPRDQLAALGELGILGLPYAEEYGGGAQPAEVYLQVLEELSRAWMTVGVSVSVHWLACFPLVTRGTPEQQAMWLPDLLGGSLLGGYCLSEPEAGSDAASLTSAAVLDGGEYVVNGHKAWITHGGVADFYSAMVRTGGPGPKGISCLLVDGQTPGLSALPRERKMGGNASPTAQLLFEDMRVPVERRMGEEGEGFAIAMAALDSGRLGIAACSVGLAQAALDVAVAYARERKQFGRPIADFQGVSFMLADMATAVAGARALYIEAARRKDAGLPFATEAAMAKLAASDMVMRVTTDAVQVLGGAGYTQDFPVEQYFRGAKVLQIVEGTNQIQRLVIGRSLGTSGG